jgi:hypothetical protein
MFEVSLPNCGAYSSRAAPINQLRRPLNKQCVLDFGRRSHRFAHRYRNDVARLIAIWSKALLRRSLLNCPGCTRTRPGCRHAAPFEPRANVNQERLTLRCTPRIEVSRPRGVSTKIPPGLKTSDSINGS